MTRKANAINGFIEELTMLALHGTALKLSLNGSNDLLSKKKGEEMLAQHQDAMKTHLVNIVEGNEEQAEALMTELGLVK